MWSTSKVHLQRKKAEPKKFRNQAIFFPPPRGLVPLADEAINQNWVVGSLGFLPSSSFLLFLFSPLAKRYKGETTVKNFLSAHEFVWLKALTTVSLPPPPLLPSLFLCPEASQRLDGGGGGGGKQTMCSTTQRTNVQCSTSSYLFRGDCRGVEPGWISPAFWLLRRSGRRREGVGKREREGRRYGAEYKSTSDSLRFANFLNS